MKRKKEIKCYLFVLNKKLWLWCPHPPQSIVFRGIEVDVVESLQLIMCCLFSALGGKKKPPYGMTLLFWGPTLVKEVFGTQANWPLLVGGDDRGVDDTNIFAQTPITPKFLFLFFVSNWHLSLSQSKNTHIYYSWN